MMRKISVQKRDTDWSTMYRCVPSFVAICKFLLPCARRESLSVSLKAVLATRPCYHNRVIVARAEFRIHSSVNILICAIKAAFCLAFLLRAEWEREAWQDSSADSIAFNMNFISAQIIFVQFFYSQLKCLSSTIKPNSSTFPYRRRWRTFSVSWIGRGNARYFCLMQWKISIANVRIWNCSESILGNWIIDLISMKCRALTHVTRDLSGPKSPRANVTQVSCG